MIKLIMSHEGYDEYVAGAPPNAHYSRRNITTIPYSGTAYSYQVLFFECGWNVARVRVVSAVWCGAPYC